MLRNGGSLYKYLRIENLVSSFWVVSDMMLSIVQVVTLVTILIPTPALLAKPSTSVAQVPYGMKFKSQKIGQEQRNQGSAQVSIPLDRRARGLLYHHQPVLYLSPGYTYPVPTTEAPPRGYVYKKPTTKPTTTTTTTPEPAIEQEQDIDSSYLTPAPPPPSIPEKEFEESPVDLDEREDKWDIRNSVPGTPGDDYPVLSHIPKTSFSCEGRIPGFYADPETKCQVYHRCSDCMDNVRLYMHSFLCPNGTTFNQEILACDWWANVHCENTHNFYKINEELNQLGPDGKYLELSGMRQAPPLQQKKIAPGIIPKNERRPLPSIYRTQHKGHDDDHHDSSSSEESSHPPRPAPPTSRPAPPITSRPKDPIVFNEFRKPIGTSAPTSTKNPIESALDNPDYFDPNTVDIGQRNQAPAPKPEESDDDYFNNEQVEVRSSIEYDQKLDNDPLNPAASSRMMDGMMPNGERPTSSYPYVMTASRTMTTTTTASPSTTTTTVKTQPTTRKTTTTTTTTTTTSTTKRPIPIETTIRTPVTTTSPPESEEDLNDIQPLVGLQRQLRQESEDDVSGFIVNTNNAKQKFSSERPVRVTEAEYLPPTKPTPSPTYAPPTSKPKLTYLPPVVKQPPVPEYGVPNDSYPEVGPKQAIPPPPTLETYPNNPYIQAPIPQSVIQPSLFNYIPYGHTHQDQPTFTVVTSHIPTLNFGQLNPAISVAQPSFYFNPLGFDLTALGSSNYAAIGQPKPDSRG